MKIKLPGDPSNSELVEQAIRVNHAGEYGAKRIYQGQLAFTKDDDFKRTINYMMNQELEHLKYFEDELILRRIRPSALFHLWHYGGYALGAITALMGKNAALACTEAVEEVIDEHYSEQLHTIEGEVTLKENIEKFRDDELEHHSLASGERTQNSLAFNALKFVISGTCRVAIKLARKI